MVSSLSRVLILHFFYKITNERGTKTVFIYAHVKWFYGQSERAYNLNYFIIYIVWKCWRFHELMWNFLFDKATCVTIWYDSWYAFDLCLTSGKSIVSVQNTRFYSNPSDTIRQRWMTFSRPTFDFNKSFSVSHHRKIDYSDGIHRIRFVSVGIHRTPME